MAKSKKALDEAIRVRYMGSIREFLTNSDEEVLVTGSNQFAIPCVDEEGNEKFLVILFQVPTGSRDGDAYDGYSMAEDYSIKLKNKAEEAEKRAAEKARKIERDKAMREAKAKAKAEREKNAES